MSTLRRVRLVVLFLLVAAFLAGTPAHAGNGVPFVSTGVEPTASGEYQLQRSGKAYNERFNLTVRCAGLRPGATYYAAFWVVAWWDNNNPPPFPAAREAFTADALGNGGVTIKAFRTYPYAWHHIDVSNESGAAILTTGQ
jgi:hypothetical protein